MFTAQLTIDKAAAARFIKNAIAQATIPTNAPDPGPSTATATTRPHLGDGDEFGNGNNKAPDVRAPAKITAKMLERKKYHEALREEAQPASDEDGEPLDIFDNDGYEEEERDKGKANATAASPVPIPDVPPPSLAASRKRRRPPVDPFAGSCGSHQFMFFLSSTVYHTCFLSQAMAMVQIIPRPVPLLCPLRLILHQALRVLSGRFEKIGGSTSAMMSCMVASLYPPKSIRQGRKKNKETMQKKSGPMMTWIGCY